METVWEWAKVRADVYLEGEFESKDEFCACPPPNVTEFMILMDGQPAAHLGLIETERGTKISLITSPYADVKKLVPYLYALAHFAKQRGASLYTEIPLTFAYRSARKLGRMIGLPNYRDEEHGNKEETTAAVAV